MGAAAGASSNGSRRASPGAHVRHKAYRLIEVGQPIRCQPRRTGPPSRGGRGCSGQDLSGSRPSVGCSSDGCSAANEPHLVGPAGGIDRLTQQHRCHRSGERVLDRIDQAGLVLACHCAVELGTDSPVSDESSRERAVSHLDLVPSGLRVPFCPTEKFPTHPTRDPDRCRAEVVHSDVQGPLGSLLRASEASIGCVTRPTERTLLFIPTVRMDEPSAAPRSLSANERQTCRVSDVSKTSVTSTRRQVADNVPRCAGWAELTSPGGPC